MSHHAQNSAQGALIWAMFSELGWGAASLPCGRCVSVVDTLDASASFVLYSLVGLYLKAPGAGLLRASLCAHVTTQRVPCVQVVTSSLFLHQPARTL